MLFEKSTDITTNIWLLTNLRKGAFFQNPELGNDLLNQVKLTDSTPAEAKQMIEEALTPLIQSGRAESIEVTVERDDTDRTRLNYKVQAKQPDGLIINYDSWYPVV